jgi:hypothetical protein
MSLIYLEPVPGFVNLTIGETDGSKTFEESLLFNLDADVRQWGCGDLKSKPTLETKVTVFEMVRDGSFKQVMSMFPSTTESLSLTPSQIIWFVEQYRGALRDDRYATFFPMLCGTEQMVMYTMFDHTAPIPLRVKNFTSDTPWNADVKRRFVLPLEIK